MTIGEAYRASGGKPAGVVLGYVIGIGIRTAYQTVIVLAVLRIFDIV